MNKALDALDTHSLRLEYFVVCGWSTHVMVVVGVGVLAVPGAVRQGAIMAVWVARWEQAAGAVEQCQAVGEFVVEVMAPLG